jgi:hypothetical protein
MASSFFFCFRTETWPRAIGDFPLVSIRGNSCHVPSHFQETQVILPLADERVDEVIQP